MGNVFLTEIKSTSSPLNSDLKMVSQTGRIPKQSVAVSTPIGAEPLQTVQKTDIPKESRDSPPNSTETERTVLSPSEEFLLKNLTKLVNDIETVEDMGSAVIQMEPAAKTQTKQPSDDVMSATSQKYDLQKADDIKGLPENLFDSDTESKAEQPSETGNKPQVVKASPLHIPNVSTVDEIYSCK